MGNEHRFAGQCLSPRVSTSKPVFSFAYTARLFLLLPFRRFSGTNSSDVLHGCAGLLRSANGAPTPSNLSSKDRVSDSRSPLPARLGSRP
jgi:hypothetical protein